VSGGQERRRDVRIRANAANFALHVPGAKPLRCEVVNLSRLGFGMELPEMGASPFLDAIQSGSHVSGELTVAGSTLAAEAEVRVRKGRFLGLEYTNDATGFVRSLRALLTPEYVASSIHAIAPEFLSADLRASYQSDDFECTIFKPGVSGQGSMVQLYWDGKVVEVAGDVARFVPPLLVREGSRRRGGVSGAELLRSFTSFDDEGNEQALREFFQSLARLFAAWPMCPLELHALVKKQLEQK